MTKYEFDDWACIDDDFACRDDDFACIDDDWACIDDDWACIDDVDAVCDDERDGLTEEEADAYEKGKRGMTYSKRYCSSRTVTDYLGK